MNQQNRKQKEFTNLRLYSGTNLNNKTKTLLEVEYPKANSQYFTFDRNRTFSEKKDMITGKLASLLEKKFNMYCLNNFKPKKSFFPINSIVDQQNEIDEKQFRRENTSEIYQIVQQKSKFWGSQIKNYKMAFKRLKRLCMPKEKPASKQGFLWNFK